MEKISGILPANSRVTTVDIKSSGHMRGGMPTFGRPVGVTAVAEKQAALSEKAKQMDAAAKLPTYTPDVAISRHKEQMEMRVKPQVTQDPKAQIVQNMADQFFMNKAARLDAEEAVGSDVEMNVGPEYDMNVEVPGVDEEDMAAVGQHLDVQA